MPAWSPTLRDELHTPPGAGPLPGGRVPAALAVTLGLVSGLAVGVVLGDLAGITAAAVAGVVLLLLWLLLPLALRQRRADDSAGQGELDAACRRVASALAGYRSTTQ